MEEEGMLEDKKGVKEGRVKGVRRRRRGRERKKEMIIKGQERNLQAWNTWQKTGMKEWKKGVQGKGKEDGRTKKNTRAWQKGWLTRKDKLKKDGRRDGGEKTGESGEGRDKG